MEYHSNLDKVIKQMQKKIGPKAIDLLVKDIATNIWKASVKRIFVNGINVNGTKIGKYSRFTKVVRSRKGLQTAFVDLTYTGAMKNNYRVRKSKSLGYVIGFSEQYGVKLAAKNEERFKCKIFGITKDDEKLTDDIIKKFILDINKKK